MKNFFCDLSKNAVGEMIGHFVAVFAMICSVTTSLAAGEKELILAEKGSPKAVIVAPAGGGKVVDFAAHELKKFLDVITDYTSKGLLNYSDTFHSMYERSTKSKKH